MAKHRTLGLLTIAATALLSSVTAPAGAVVLYATGTVAMRDVDVGADGDVFTIGRANVAGTNGGVYTWVRDPWQVQPGGGYWQELPGGGSGTRIAVDSQGRPWIVNSLAQVFRHNGSGWVRMPGVIRDLDIGADGSMYALGEPGWTNGYVYKWNGSDWSWFSSTMGKTLTVDRDGHPWVVNSSGQIRRYDGSAWITVPGTARDIDAGADGTIFMLTSSTAANGSLYRWNGTGWSYEAQVGARVAVSPTGAPIVVPSDGEVLSVLRHRLHGDTNCLSSSTDCNVCAVDVRKQLHDAFNTTKMVWQPESWYLDWTRSYPPEATPPQLPFEDSDWVISSHHVQGFVRTGSPTHPYAGSFSDDQDGAVFVIRNAGTAASPNHRLQSIHLTHDEHHPSGVHALGKWVVLSDHDRLRVFDVDAAETAVQNIVHDSVTSLFSAGGGIGIARLTAQNYVLISALPGDNDYWDTTKRVRNNYIWKLQGSIGTNNGLSAELLSDEEYKPHPDWVHDVYVGWEHDYRFSENLSVITECGTGQIYTLHTSGPDDVYGTGYFRLSRLEESTDGPVLRSLAVYAKSQDMANCYLRAAGTAYANDWGIIDLYCHSYDPRNEWWETAENVPFYRGIGYHSSCFNRCGGSAPSGCWCDSSCATYGDCCTDKVSTCGS